MLTCNRLDINIDSGKTSRLFLERSMYCRFVKLQIESGMCVIWFLESAMWRRFGKLQIESGILVSWQPLNCMSTGHPALPFVKRMFEPGFHIYLQQL
jgi:hypothetical protein